MIRHSDSLQLVWRIAEIEASNLKQRSIHPAHFFLGLLKVVEIDLVKCLKDERGIELREIQQDVTTLKNCLGEFIVEITYTRRFLRKILPEGEAPVDSDKGRLRRTQSSRNIFLQAEKLAQKSNGPALPLHLLLALLEANDPQIVTALEKSDGNVNEFKQYVENYLRKSKPE